MLSKIRLVALVLVLLLLATSAWAGEANVFVYHRFGDSRYPSTNISIDTFTAQLQFLQERDYTVLTLGEIVDRLRAGKTLPERCAALTVDDAYTTFLSGAMPLLRRFGYPATLFVNTNTVGGRGYLDWDELRGLAAEGVEIGNHSASHLYLLNRKPGEDHASWRQRITTDIRKAQGLIERKLGRGPLLFAYPFGEYSPEVIEILKGEGFLGAAAQQSGVVAAGGDLFTLARFPMGGPYATLEGFKEKLGMRALPVTVLSPAGPVIEGEDPPTLLVRIESRGIDLTRLRCFVQGQGDATIVPDSAGGAGTYVVRAGAPLVGRRNKYTLTAPAKDGGRWYWFSQLWVNPTR
jgi:peptidoglycan/xylan/chitin deacetylase (PgdA/CDA1 family)